MRVLEKNTGRSALFQFNWIRRVRQLINRIKNGNGELDKIQGHLTLVQFD